jgi:hypothetical protein
MGFPFIIFSWKVRLRQIGASLKRKYDRNEETIIPDPDKRNAVGEDCDIFRYNLVEHVHDASHLYNCGMQLHRSTYSNHW